MIIAQPSSFRHQEKRDCTQIKCFVDLLYLFPNNTILTQPLLERSSTARFPPDVEGTGWNTTWIQPNPLHGHKTQHKDHNDHSPEFGSRSGDKSRNGRKEGQSGNDLHGLGVSTMSDKVWEAGGSGGPAGPAGDIALGEDL
jgi:hypothetical protein